MTQELLPCPFCGGEARLWPVIMPFDADCDAITVQCLECDVIGADVLVDQDVHGPSDLPELEAEAIAAWNTRAASPTGNWQETLNEVQRLEAENAALRADVERLTVEDLAVAMREVWGDVPHWIQVYAPRLHAALTERKP